MKRIIGVILALAALAACEAEPLPLPPPPPPPPHYGPPPAGDLFRASDFAWSTTSGTGRIIGVMAYRNEGVRYTCQGEEVVLAPETPWSRLRMRTLYLSNTSAALPVDEVKARTPPEHGAEYARYARTTTCNAYNRFVFRNLPDGPWYVITVATPIGGGQRIAIMRRVITRGDDVAVALR